MIVTTVQATEFEPHRWCLQTRSGTLKQDIAREVVRRLNRRLYLMNPSTQLEREDDDVHITVGVQRGIGTEDSGRVLLEVAVGPVVERENLEDLLDSGLVDRLLRRNYLWIEEPFPTEGGTAIVDDNSSIQQIIAFKTLKDVFWWSPADYSLSVWSGFARISDRAGIFVDFGNSELGYPIWNGGTFRVGVVHSFVKVWVQSPLLGVNTKTLFVTRKLDGAIGAGAAFDVDKVGGTFGFADLGEASNSIGLVDSIHIHFVSTFAQAYYIFSTQVSDVIPGVMRVKFGGGFHEVVTGYTTPQTGSKIIKLDRGTFRGGPFIRAEYVTNALQGVHPIGEAYLQYYNGSVMIGGAFNLTSWFAIEAIGSFIFSPDPWERGVMWGVSPRIRI